MEKLLCILIPAISALGLLFALALALRVKKQAPGTDRMREIAASIHEGATAFLFSEYKIIVIFVAVIFLAIGFGIGNWLEAVCFLVGALFSVAAGFFGMQVATLANVRTANAAKEKGMA